MLNDPAERSGSHAHQLPAFAESFSATQFQATVAHEFGQILGIRHKDVTEPNQLINDTLSDIVTPQEFDIKSAQYIWGPR